MNKDKELKDFIASIHLEVDRQENKWGTRQGAEDLTPDRWNTILVEEVGEVAESILKEDKDNFREELIQVASVVFQMWRRTL